MKIYADTNVYGRLLDDQSQLRVRLEAEASLALFEATQNGSLRLIGSDILLVEVAQTELTKRVKIEALLRLCESFIPQTDEALKLAKAIRGRCRIAPRDALHLAAAQVGQARFFLSCDDALIRKTACVSKFVTIKVLNPVEFVQQYLYDYKKT